LQFQLESSKIQDQDIQGRASSFDEDIGKEEGYGEAT
jgi:hypothetical protein